MQNRYQKLIDSRSQHYKDSLYQTLKCNVSEFEYTKISHKKIRIKITPEIGKIIENHSSNKARKITTISDKVVKFAFFPKGSIIPDLFEVDHQNGLEKKTVVSIERKIEYNSTEVRLKKKIKECVKKMIQHKKFTCDKDYGIDLNNDNDDTFDTIEDETDEIADDIQIPEVELEDETNDEFDKQNEQDIIIDNDDDDENNENDDDDDDDDDSSKISLDQDELEDHVSEVGLDMDSIFENEQKFDFGNTTIQERMEFYSRKISLDFGKLCFPL
jgi:archaellin